MKRRAEARENKIKSKETLDKNKLDQSQTSTADLGLEQAVQARLGGLLKISYQALVSEPIPDRFLNLLERLERAERTTAEKLD